MQHLQVFRFLGLLLLGFLPLECAEQDALAIDATIQARHMPYGTILNPIFDVAGGGSIVNYTRCGDSALWTGHYLAAEAFRYKVTNSPEALANMRAALAGLGLLREVTGTGVLARCAIPEDSPYAAAIASEEAANGIFHSTLHGKAWMWVGNTSRDQYSGVFFGLGAAYDLTGDKRIRFGIASLVVRLLGHLLDAGWSVKMPDGSTSTTFLLRPDQQLALLQIGRRVDARRFEKAYEQAAASLASAVPVPLGFDALDDHDSYFKFNLDFINLYNLIRLEESDARRLSYEAGFGAVRSTTDNHLNAHFNMIDRALHGPDAARDAETRADLDAWLKRPRTDGFVDWRGKIASCGDPNLACHPIPVEDRPPSDFVWQLSPFQLSGGGKGIIEGAGIDYILPYWMARYYGVVQE